MGQNASNTLEYPNLTTWQHGHEVFFIFWKWFEILTPSSYLHLKTFPIGFYEKNPKADVTFKNMGKML
jgi:hypothetical protein